MISEIVYKLSFALFSVIIAAADIKTGKVPRLAFIFAFPFFIILKAVLNDRPLWEPAAGALIALTVFLLAYFISRKKLGLADVWYSALIGLVLGLWQWYAAIAGACITGILYMLASGRRRIPFIPFMALGSIAISFIPFI